MKIFQVSEYISSAFDIILNKKQKENLYNYLEILYIKKLINEEILLNLIKAFVLIFYNNPEHCNIYLKIFNSLSEEETSNLFKLLKKVNLSYQMKMSESIINKIILTINSYIINNYNNNNINYYNILMNVYNIYDTIKLNKKITLNNKIQLYIVLLKNNSNISDVRQILGIVNKFL